MSLTFIDFFAGIGGGRRGLEMAGHKCVGYCEIDKFASASYRMMHTATEEQRNYIMSLSSKRERKQEILKEEYLNGEYFATDITKINEKDIPQFDICLAGFPCQAFSLAGKRQGFDDNYKGLCRGTLFMDVARICEYHKPRVIFCENVKGLKIHDRGRTFEIIRKTFEDLGYKVFSEVLNSKDFGVPQNRERIYIVAFRNDIAPEEFEFPKATDDTKRIKDIVEEKPVPAKYYLSDVYVETLRRHKARHEAKGNGFGYEIREWDGIAGAIVCGGMDRERNLLIDKRQKDLTPTTHIKGEINKEGIRKMTPREWARLQGWGDEYFDRAAAVNSDTQLYKQAGNGMTVNVVYEIGKRME